MVKSFFTGTDVELYNGTKVFSAAISSTPTAFGLTAAQATAYALLSDDYINCYDATVDPKTRTKSKTQAKTDAKIALRAMASDLAKIVGGTSTVTNEQRLDLGLSVRATPTAVGESRGRRATSSRP
ncbi:MAG TPA: hypothetical protein VK324_17915 [Tepidisphaeraceae bacterium]|nr:hypothetical protein [Tepidisphaeraceae bacterium]